MKVALVLVALLALWPAMASSYQPTGMKFDHTAITYSCGSSELQQAVQQWAAVSSLIDGGCSGTPDVLLTQCSPWPYSNNILGLAWISASSNHTTIQGAICINPLVGDFLGVYVHEVGHVLWSAHSEDDYAAMAPWCCFPIGPDDIAGIQAVYGPPEVVVIEPHKPSSYRVIMPMVSN